MESAQMFTFTSPFTPRARRSLLRKSQTEVHPETPPFSNLLGTILGSPFLTTSDLPPAPDFDVDVVDGSFVTVPQSHAVTRPFSPTLGFHMPSRPFFINSTRRYPDLPLSHTNSGKPSKGILPRIWDAISSPGKKAKSKPKQIMSYDDLPLDGEEGELIDDEACFIDISAVTGIDIIARLPPELSIYLLSFLDLPSIIACLSVSKFWRACAEDNAVWRELFHGRDGWNIDLRKAKYSSIGRSKSRPSAASSFATATASLTRLAPLSLHWRSLYKSRLELDKRWVTGEAAVTRIAGHSDSVYCLEFDSKRIVTGSRDRTIKVWSLETGKFIASFRGHAGSVLCLKFDKEWDSTDQDARGFMVTGSSDHSVMVWDLYAGGSRADVRAVLHGHTGGVLDLRIDNNYIVSCSKDTLIRVWSRTTFELHTTLRGHQGPVNAVGLQGGKVVSASGDGKMMMWDIKSGTRLRTFEGHDRGLACIEFKDDLIVSGSNDCKIKVWSASRGECLQTLTGHDLLVRALSFDPAIGRLVSASYDKTVKVWDLNTGKLVREFKNTHVSHIFDVKFDVRRIVSTSHDQKIAILDFSEGLDTSIFV